MDFSKMKRGVFNTKAPSKVKESGETYDFPALVIEKTPTWGKKEGRKTAPDGSPIMIEGYIGSDGKGKQCTFKLNERAIKYLNCEIQDGKLTRKAYFTLAYMSENGKKFSDGRLYCTVSEQKEGTASAYINKNAFTFYNDTMHEELRPLIKQWGRDVNEADVICEIHKLDMTSDEIRQFGQMYEIFLHNNDETVDEQEAEEEASVESAIANTQNGFFN
jgi:hypothetical protein